MTLILTEALRTGERCCKCRTENSSIFCFEYRRWQGVLRSSKPQDRRVPHFRSSEWSPSHVDASLRTIIIIIVIIIISSISIIIMLFMCMSTSTSTSTSTSRRFLTNKELSLGVSAPLSASERPSLRTEWNPLCYHSCHILPFQPILWNKYFPPEPAKTTKHSPKSILEGGRIWQVWLHEDVSLLPPLPIRNYPSYHVPYLLYPTLIHMYYPTYVLSYPYTYVGSLSMYKEPSFGVRAPLSASERPSVRMGLGKISKNENIKRKPCFVLRIRVQG